MSKFKVGDKVKLIKTNGNYVSKIGDTGTIYRVGSDGLLGVRTKRGEERLWHQEYTVILKENKMTKYYRVSKPTFLWDEGAIIEFHEEDGCDGGYRAINDLWDACDEVKDEYISARIVEHKDNESWFERVYPIGKLEKMVFGSKKQAQAAASTLYKDKK